MRIFVFCKIQFQLQLILNTMKTKIIALLFIICLHTVVFATNFTVSIVGTTYSPATLTIHVGDVVTISASDMHPLVQVGKTNYDNLTATALVGGWGTQMADYTYTASKVETIYFVCGNHVGLGMKGSITVLANTTGFSSTTDNSTDIQFYPNPVSSLGTLFIGKGANASVQIFNINGQLAKSLQTNNAANQTNTKVEISFDDFESGYYFVVIVSDKKRYVKKVEVIH